MRISRPDRCALQCLAVRRRPPDGDRGRGRLVRQPMPAGARRLCGPPFPKRRARSGCEDLALEYAAGESSFGCRRYDRMQTAERAANQDLACAVGPKRPTAFAWTRLPSKRSSSCCRPNWEFSNRNWPSSPCWLGEDRVIDAQLVRDNVGGWRTRTTWEMIDAAADGRAAVALAELDRLISAGEKPHGLLPQMSSSLRRFGAATAQIEAAEADRRRLPLAQRAGASRRAAVQVVRRRTATSTDWTRPRQAAHRLAASGRPGHEEPQLVRRPGTDGNRASRRAARRFLNLPASANSSTFRLFFQLPGPSLDVRLTMRNLSRSFVIHAHCCWQAAVASRRG